MEEQEVWVVSFGGYATEEVVINRVRVGGKQVERYGQGRSSWVMGRWVCWCGNEVENEHLAYRYVFTCPTFIISEQGFEFIDNLTRDGKDVHTEFIGVALYDQPARLVNRHNELWLWSKAKPSLEAVEQSAVEMIKQLFSAMVKRIGGHGA